MKAKNSRKIRTYTLRQSRMTMSQRLALDHFWTQYGLKIQDGAINSQEIFGRKAPLILEIGFGMGDSLFSLAKAMPNHDFIGIEVHSPGIGALLGMLEKEAMTNVRVYNADAREIMTHCIPDHSLDAILIFFPDPWPKRRHHKRRLIQLDFVKLLQNKLKLGGILHLATDWEDYAIQMMQTIATLKSFSKVSNEDELIKNLLYRPQTKFEQRGKKLGYKIWDLLFVKQ